MVSPKLGKYELHEQLGRGGFGTVYRAIDLTLGREVALKILHPAYMADPDFIERFRREARTVAVLEHPNIVTVYDLDEADGRAYIAMRYLPGGSLRDRLKKEGRIPYPIALEIVHQVAAGLQAAHARGLVHRDIKPENILFSTDGQAVITDFGLAKAVQSSTSSASSSFGGAGTPSYRPPELWRGNPPASPATDEYSLAAVFCEMLSGEQLFNGETPDEIITKHVIDGASLPEMWPQGVPDGLNEVLGKALAMKPEERYPDADGLAEELERLVSVKSEQTETASQSQQSPRRKYSNTRIGIGAGFLVGLTGIIMVGLLLSGSFDPQIPSPTQTQVFTPSWTETIIPTRTSLLITPRLEYPTVTNVTITALLKVSQAWLLAGPGLDHPTISDEYSRGDIMMIIGRFGNWFQVKAPDGLIGWLYKDYLDLKSINYQAIPALTNVPTSPATRYAPSLTPTLTIHVSRTPTVTPKPSKTYTPSDTPTPTDTPTPSDTPTDIPTETPTP